MNALYLDPDGDDLRSRSAGVGDLRAGGCASSAMPRRRIREDVLRILRFYRFHAHYGRGEADARRARRCRELDDLLPTLSAERVAAELLKLLAAPDPVRDA